MTKKALVSPEEVVEYISNWTLDLDTGVHMPTYTIIENAARIADVVDVAFDVAEPMFWVDCNDDNMADFCYYDTVTNTVVLKPDNAVNPDSQPVNMDITS